MTQEPKRQFDWDILGRLDERTKNTEERLKMMDDKLDSHMLEEKTEWGKHAERVTVIEKGLNQRVGELELMSNRIKWTAAVVIAVPTVLTFTRDWITKIFRRLFMPE